MANINNLIGCAAYINMQAGMLLNKTTELLESVRNLHEECTVIRQHEPGTFAVNIDLCGHNQLIRKTNATADVITRLNAVFDVLNVSTKKAEEDAKKINKRLRRKRRKVVVVDEDSDDDDISFVMRQQQQQERVQI